MRGKENEKRKGSSECQEVEELKGRLRKERRRREKVVELVEAEQKQSGTKGERDRLRRK